MPPEENPGANQRYPPNGAHRMHAWQQDVLCSAWETRRASGKDSGLVNPKAVFSHLSCSLYSNDQPRSEDTQHFIYADDLGISAQHMDFTVVEQRLSKALEELTPYYEKNYLRANPSKTQVCTFHLRNREAKRQLKVNWSGTTLEHCETPVTLDR